MLTIVTYLWGDKYGLDDVLKLKNGVGRHLEQEHRFVLITDRPLTSPQPIYPIPAHDLHLCGIRGCFARLRLFDPSFQNAIGAGERIVCMDLDSVVTGPLDALFNRPESFIILRGANAANPCPYNGSLWMLRAGYRPDVWSEFTLPAAALIPKYVFPDDQGWFAHMIPDAPGWYVGARSGVYAFQKPGWPEGYSLPSDARLVVFPGWRSPKAFRHLPWVIENWK